MHTASGVGVREQRFGAGRRRPRPRVDRLASLAAALVALLAPASASAQLDAGDPAYDLGADLHHVHAPSTHQGFMATEAAQTLGRLEYDLGLGVQVSDRPLTVALSNGTDVVLLRRAALADLNMAVGLTDHLDIALRLPLVTLRGLDRGVDADGAPVSLIDPDACLGLTQSVDTAGADLDACDFVPALIQSDHKVQVGDMRLQLRYAYDLNESHHLAVLPALSFATGQPQTLAGVGNMVLELGTAYQYATDRLKAGVNLGFRYFTGPPPAIGVLSLGHELVVRMGLAYAISPWCVDLMADVVASTVVAPPSITPDRSPAELLLGARIRPTPKLQLTLGVGQGLSAGYGAPRLRGMANLTWMFGSDPTLHRQQATPNYPDCCYRKTATLKVDASQVVNATQGGDGQSIRVMVRRLDEGAFAAESYTDVARVASEPDDSVLALVDVLPGQKVSVGFRKPGKGRVAIYALYGRPGGEWRVELQDAEVPNTVRLSLDEGGIVRGR